MRYITTISALVAVVYGACEADGDMACAPTKKKEDQFCIYRKTMAVEDPNNRNYKSVLRKDK